MTSKDFSVVVQGPIMGKPGEDYELQKTLQCVESIKRTLPEAEVIISTWKGSDCSHLYFDKLIFNDDPGAITYNDYELKHVLNNTNRQIVSTYNGLKQASRMYSIKMRPDFKLESTAFFSLLGQFPEVNKFPFFKHRILVPTFVSRDPEKIPLLFHISDLFQVGYTEDLLDLWDIPLQPEPYTTRAFPYGTMFINNPFRTYKYGNRFAAEQYIWYAFAKKKGLNLSLNYQCQIPVRTVPNSLLSIIDNFVIATPEQLGIMLPTSIRDKFNQTYFYTHEKWRILYTELCVKRSEYELRKRTVLIFLCSLKFSMSNIKYLAKQKVKTILKKQLPMPKPANNHGHQHKSAKS